MTAVRTTDPVPSVLMPVASLSLLGVGAEGAALMGDFGLSATGFDAEYAVMVERLGRSTADDAPLLADVAARVTAAARAATGTLSVTGLTRAVVPTYFLACGQQVLVLRVHGAAAEWLLVLRADVPSLVQSLLERAPSGVLLIASRRGQPLAAAAVNDGELRTAVRAVAGAPPESPADVDAAILWLMQVAAEDGEATA